MSNRCYFDSSTSGQDSSLSLLWTFKASSLSLPSITITHSSALVLASLVTFRRFRLTSVRRQLCSDGPNHPHRPQSFDSKLGNVGIKSLFTWLSCSMKPRWHQPRAHCSARNKEERDQKQGGCHTVAKTQTIVGQSRSTHTTWGSVQVKRIDWEVSSVWCGLSVNEPRLRLPAQAAKQSLLCVLTPTSRGFSGYRWATSEHIEKN